MKIWAISSAFIGIIVALILSLRKVLYFADTTQTRYFLDNWGWYLIMVVLLIGIHVYGMVRGD